MLEYVLITIRTMDGAVCADYRLPAETAVGKLLPLLRDVLAQQYPAVCNGWAKIRLYASGYPLNEEKSLADHGIWDGRELVVQEAL